MVVRIQHIDASASIADRDGIRSTRDTHRDKFRCFMSGDELHSTVRIQLLNFRSHAEFCIKQLKKFSSLRQIFMPILILSCCTKRHVYANLTSKALLYASISSIKCLLIILSFCLLILKQEILCQINNDTELTLINYITGIYIPNAF